MFNSYSGLFEVANENNEEVILDLQYLSPDREHQTQYQFLPPTLKGYAQLAPLNELVQSYITDNGKAIDELVLIMIQLNLLNIVTHVWLLQSAIREIVIFCQMERHKLSIVTREAIQMVTDLVLIAHQLGII